MSAIDQINSSLGAVAVTPISLITSTSKASTDTNTVVTSNIDTTGATWLVVGVGYLPSVSGTLTDSKSNTWNALTLENSGAAIGCQIFYCNASPSVGSGHNFTWTITAGFPVIGVWAFSNASLYDTGKLANNGAFAETIQAGSLTPTAANSVLVSVLGSGSGGGGATIDNSFILGPTARGGTANNQGTAFAYKIQTSATAENPTWTDTVGFGHQLGVSSAVFKHS